MRGGGEKNGQRKRHTVRDVTKCGVNPGRGFQQYQAIIRDDYRRASLEILNPGQREYARLILLENASHRLMMDLSHPDFLRCGSWAHGRMGACTHEAQALNSAPGMALSLATRLYCRACFEIRQFRTITDKTKP